jgi:hypothetical protein
MSFFGGGRGGSPKIPDINLPDINLPHIRTTPYRPSSEQTPRISQLNGRLSTTQVNIDQLRQVLTNLEKKATAGVTSAQAAQTIMQITGHLDFYNPGVASGLGVVDQGVEIDNELIALKAVAEIEMAGADKIGRNKYLDLIKTIDEMRREAQTIQSDALGIQDQLQRGAKGFEQWLANLTEAIQSGLSTQTPEYEQLSPEDKVFLTEINPQLVEYMDKLPGSGIVEVKPAGEGGSSGSKGTGGAGTGVGGTGIGGTGGTTDVAKAPVLPPTRVIGTYNGKPVYSGLDVDVPSQVVGDSGYIMEVRASGEIDLVPYNTPGEREMETAGSQISLSPTGGGTGQGFTFTLQALRDGAVDLNQFDGEVKNELMNLKNELDKEKADIQRRYGTPYVPSQPGEWSASGSRWQGGPIS